ncbi:hypothetical protein ACF3DV_05495 [Chlorogloeopsis fritschii PCC 9212]|uniref:Uncharacterized protein n=1 Tax=Chlorogloeopsis fritschii PCC 6912 TaxID=211165 RepID=A0A3S0XYB3_CHLFR|nr:hypothetical protein [Chlorogloeopsis fritschii]RUR80791.1 hypothetical protein PCC6912_28130 [Chlorogloeopsis fritschii PCC 6912]
MHNAATIYTVAQIALNELQLAQDSQMPKPTIAALPSALEKIDRTQLLKQYGSYNACRQAAKEKGIKFSRTPSWEQLTAAFSYAQAFEKIIEAYMKMYPNQKLKGTKFEFTI